MRQTSASMVEPSCCKKEKKSSSFFPFSSVVILFFLFLYILQHKKIDYQLFHLSNVY
jgi:hypothetical protein